MNAKIKQCPEDWVPLYKEDFIDWCEKCGKSKNTARNYIRFLRYLYEQVIKKFWKECASEVYNNPKDVEIYGEICTEEELSDYTYFWGAIDDNLEVMHPLFLCNSFYIADLCIKKASERLEELKLSKTTLNGWSSALQTYKRFIEYLKYVKQAKSQYNPKWAKHELRLRSPEMPLLLLEEFKEWEKTKKIAKSKSNYSALLKDLHSNIFPDYTSDEESPFDLIVPFFKEYPHVALDILNKYKEILIKDYNKFLENKTNNLIQKKIITPEHLSALNKFIEFLDKRAENLEKSGNLVEYKKDNSLLPLPEVLKYDLDSFCGNLYKPTPLMNHVMKEFQIFIRRFNRTHKAPVYKPEDISKIVVMAEEGFIKLNQVELLLAQPCHQSTIVCLYNGEVHDVYTPNKDGDIEHAVVRTLDDLEVRLWKKHLVLAVKDYPKYPETKPSVQ